MAADGFKLTEPHREDCWCEDREDDMTFIVLDGTEYRDRIGRRQHSTNSWYRFRCNDPRCPAVALVRWDRLSSFITAGIRSLSGGEGES
jgi:hypothetical protein